MSFRFVDLFCGGGGSVSGAIDALRMAGVNYEGRCFNHWDVAIKTIQTNYPEMIPDFDRACAPVESVLSILDELSRDELPVKDCPVTCLRIVKVLEEAGIVME